jgi:ferric-dicitrate binding protein FerR (iron transport regulator)
MLAVLLSLPSAPAFAAKPKAPAAAGPSLAFVEGTVTFGAKGHMKEGRAGDALRDGDSVATARKASAVIAMPDGSKLKLKELSNIVLRVPDGDGGEIGGTLTLGGVFAKVAKQAAGRVFRVRAGDAVASVRGTQFFTAFGRPGGDLWLCVHEGLVDVSAPRSRQSVPAGKGVLVKAGKDVTAPQAYAWTKDLNWNMDPGEGSVEDAVDLDKAYSDLLDQDYR